jgi:hypothetical protein
MLTLTIGSEIWSIRTIRQGAETENEDNTFFGVFTQTRTTKEILKLGRN